MPQPPLTGVIRFGVFELEPQAGVLRKHGVRIRLQEQPLRVLLALIEKRGEPVTREELHQKVWPDSAFDDFDHSLNIAVNKIREALGDAADTPRFVETLPRRGYRFIAPIEGGGAPSEAALDSAAPVRAGASKWILLAGAALAAIATVGAVAVRLLTPAAAPPALEMRRLTNDGLTGKSAPVLSDGARLYFMAGSEPDQEIIQVPASGGESTRLPVVLPPAAFSFLFDLRPDGQELMFGAFPNSDGVDAEAWTVRVADGSTRRVGELRARNARYSPDGGRIAFTSGGIRGPGSLWVAVSDGSNPRRLIELKDREVVTPCWSPDGKRIAFGQVRRSSQHANAWEIREDGTGLRRVLPDWLPNHTPGGWTPDGGLLLISEGQIWIAQPRRFFEGKQPPPLQLSANEPLFESPIQMRDGRAYAVGTTELGQLQRFDIPSRSWQTHLGGISAFAVAYSRDGQHVVYTTHPGRELWVRRADGSRPVRLTAPPMQSWTARWSPDDRTIAFMGKSSPDEAWRIYLIDAEGGNLRLACPKNCVPQGDFAWAPDGKKIVFSTPVSQYYTGPSWLRMVDLQSGGVTKFPGGERLHSPRWAPDGSALLAMFASYNPGDHGTLRIYHPSDGKWQSLPTPGSWATEWPSWSHDGRSIWYYDFVRGAIMRCLVRENRHEQMVPLNVGEMTGGYIAVWFNLTADDEPMILRRRDIQQIYALELKPR
jgi:Tol biopolymer transport system component/DNA-binding winged helix-turn-helix (wHTH) protein